METDADIKNELRDEWRIVKAVFRKYHDNQLYLKDSELPSFTDQYQVVLSFESDGGVNLVGEYVLKRKEALKYCENVVSCVNRLSALERKIIIPSYLTREYSAPWQIFEKLHIGRTLFYTSKGRAIGKLHVLFLVQGLMKSTDKARTETN